MSGNSHITTASDTRNGQHENWPWRAEDHERTPLGDFLVNNPCPNPLGFVARVVESRPVVPKSKTPPPEIIDRNGQPVPASHMRLLREQHDNQDLALDR